jgi:protein-L-isoaspartate(D-aspartate) O-methyltransferase
MEYDLVHQLSKDGFTDTTVLAALMRVDRATFVPEAYRPLAHKDEALPIACGQTISQPYVVAMMTAALQVKPGEKVLEVGTGSGYQAAVLAELGCEVYSIERIEELSTIAATNLVSKDYRVHLKVGDGAEGWPEEGPFAAIVVTAATNEIPRKLVNQLLDGRRMVLPLGPPSAQELSVVTRHGHEYSVKPILGVRFVPLL